MGDCITVTNHTSRPLEIVTFQDKTVADINRRSAYTIAPKESMVVFIGRVERLEWVKS